MCFLDRCFAHMCVRHKQLFSLLIRLQIVFTINCPIHKMHKCMQCQNCDHFSQGAICTLGFELLVGQKKQRLFMNDMEKSRKSCVEEGKKKKKAGTNKCLTFLARKIILIDSQNRWQLIFYWWLLLWCAKHPGCNHRPITRQPWPHRPRVCVLHLFATELR